MSEKPPVSLPSAAETAWEMLSKIEFVRADSRAAGIDQVAIPVPETKYKTQLHNWADLVGRKITAVIENPNGACKNCELVMFTDDGCWAAQNLYVRLVGNLLEQWTDLAQKSAEPKWNKLTYYVSVGRLLEASVITVAEGDLLRMAASKS